MSTTLLSGKMIAVSDEDLEMWATLAVGFNTDDNLVIKYEFNRDSDPKDSGHILKATVDKDATYQLSNHLQLHPSKLPTFLQKKFGDYTNMLMPSEVEDIFRQLTDFVLDCGVRYKLERTDK